MDNFGVERNKNGKYKTILFAMTCGDTFISENEGDKRPTTMNIGD